MSDNITQITLGDPHFTEKNVDEIIQLKTKFLDLIHQKNPTFVVVLGDLNHKHERMHQVPKKHAEEFIISISLKVPVFLLVGNHERVSNTEYMTDLHPYTALQYIPNVHIIWKTELHTIKDHNFIFVPYVPVGRFKEAIETINPVFSTITAVFAHQEFKGGSYNDKTSINGDTWLNNNPLCISGHIHMYQRLQHNLLYVGTPYQTTFDESLDKTVSLFEFKSDKSWNETRIDLQMSKKIELHITPNQLKDLKLDFNNKYKLKISATSNELKTLMKSQIILDLQSKNVKIIPKTIESEEEKKMNTEIQKIDFTNKNKIKNYNFVFSERIKNNVELNKLYNEII